MMNCSRQICFHRSLADDDSRELRTHVVVLAFKFIDFKRVNNSSLKVSLDVWRRETLKWSVDTFDSSGMKALFVHHANLSFEM
jgi:hypothetical protein